MLFNYYTSLAVWSKLRYLPIAKPGIFCVVGVVFWKGKVKHCEILTKKVTEVIETFYFLKNLLISVNAAITISFYIMPDYNITTAFVTYKENLR